MHEISIAQALLNVAVGYVPSGARVREVHVRVGPLRAIQPEAMHRAWSVVTQGSLCEGAELRLELLPWKLSCPHCDLEWEAESLDPCPACDVPSLVSPGGDELLLVALEVDESQNEETAGDLALRGADTPREKGV